jgi:inner membrane protein
VGAALAEAGPRDRFALATPTLILAANVPDVDILAYAIGGEFTALAWRRGITHGVPALVVWPFIVAGIMLLFDRWIRRRRQPDDSGTRFATSARVAPRARFAPLLGLAAVGAATHPALDWLNTYGMRWWLPFDGRWSFGDAVFIIDPWLWLLAGGPVFLARSRSGKALAAWAALALLASGLVLGVGSVPRTTKIAWAVGVLALAVLRWRRTGHDPAIRRRFARGALAAAAAFVALMITGAGLAERGARADVRAAGIQPLDVMTGPRPGSLTVRDAVVRTDSGYLRGAWHWLASPRLRLDGSATPLQAGPPHVIDHALRDPRARDFLTWSRFPYARARPSPGGWHVVLGDARYQGRGLGGPEIFVPGPCF